VSQGFQTRHIPDQAMIDLVDRLYNVPRIYGVRDGETIMDYSASASFSTICKVWDNIPPKVILSKLRKLEARGLVYGHGPSGSHFTVIHEHDLPVHRWFDRINEKWRERRMTHREYKAYMNR
jgi:hypothetical protein